MKKILFILMGLLFATLLPAQTPAAFQYQAVARGAAGIVLANQSVSFRISILQGGITGLPVFQETHFISTNEFGLVTLGIGNGNNVTGNIATIDWAGNSHFLKIEMDPTGGTTWGFMGISQLLSVPYALHSKTVENDQVDDADADPANEIQVLQLTGSELTLTLGGGTVTLPSTGDNWGSQAVITDASLAGNGTTTTPLVIADGGVTSVKIQDGQVALTDLADNSVNSTRIVDESIATADLANGAVTSEKLAAGAVTGAKIAQEGAANGQVMKWNGTTWTPANDAGGSWLTSGDDLYFNTGKVGVGKIPGADLRKFQSLAENMQAVAAVNNSSSYPAIYGENLGSGPAAEFRNRIKITDGTEGEGKVLTSNALGFTSWQTPSSSPWTTSGNDIYYNTGLVGIGTASITHPLTIFNNSNTCYIRLKDSEGSEGMRIGAYLGELALINDNINENMKFVTRTATAFNTGITLVAQTKRMGINTETPPWSLSVVGGDISIHTENTGEGATDGLRIGTSNLANANAWVWNYENGDLYFGTNDQERMRIDNQGNVGIGDSSPDATLDVQGTMVVGSAGKVFSEIREITGTTGSTGESTVVSYPSGYNMGNMRVLSFEINYSGNAWVGLAGNENNVGSNPRAFYYLGTLNIMIYYPSTVHFHSRAYRMLVMKVQ